MPYYGLGVVLYQNNKGFQKVVIWTVLFRIEDILPLPQEGSSAQGFHWSALGSPEEGVSSAIALPFCLPSASFHSLI